MASKQFTDDSYKRIINKNWKQFLLDIRSTELLDEFIAAEYINQIQYRDFTDVSIESDRIRRILHLVLKKGPKGYYVFKECLNKSNHEHLVDILNKTEVELSELQRRSIVEKVPKQVVRLPPPVKHRTSTTPIMKSNQTKKSKTEKPKAAKEEIIYSRNSPVAHKRTESTQDKTEEHVPGTRATNQQAGAEGSGESKLTEDELVTIASEVIGQNWELIAPFLGIDHIVVSQIKEDDSGMINRIITMLRKWSQSLGSGATFTALKSVLDKAPESTFIHWEKFNTLMENRQSSTRPSEKTSDNSKNLSPISQGMENLSLSSSDVIPGEMGNTRRQGENMSNVNQADLSGRSYDNTQGIEQSIPTDNEFDEPDAQREMSMDISLPSPADMVENTAQQPNTEAQFLRDGLDTISNIVNDLRNRDREYVPPPPVHHLLPLAAPTVVPVEAPSDATDGAIIFDGNRDGKGRLKILENKDITVLKSFLGQQIDIGGFGSVYELKRKVPNLDIEVVLKIITVKEKNDVDKMRSITNEKLASRTMHFGIVPLLAYGGDEKQASIERSFYFVTPYMKNGNLANAIQSYNKKEPEMLTLTRRLKILYHVASAIDFLHTSVKNIRGTILHMDIKTLNIVLDAYYNARLIDFGLSREMEEGSSSIKTTKLQIPHTRGYFKTISYSQLDVYADYYNFGVVILELLTGKMPYDEKEDKELRELSPRNLQRNVMEIWKDKKKQLFPVAEDLLKLSEQCRKSVNEKNISSGTLLETIKPTINTKDLWESDGKWKCDLCMQYDAVDDSILDHEAGCRMKVCVSCMRNSFCNPIICHTCGKKITPNIGHGWHSILIAGNDLENDSLAKVFSKDVEEVKKVITSKSPLVMGLSKNEVVTIKPHTPGTSDTMKTKLIEELKKFNSSCTLEEKKTLLLYFSGHYKEQSGGFLLGSNEEFFSVNQFEEHLFSSEASLEPVRLIVFLDCCSGPKFLKEELHCSNDNVILVQMNASRGNDKTFSHEKEGSIFQRLFTQALTGKALLTKCTSITHSDQCQNCYIDNDFVNISSLQEFIDKHYKAYKHVSKPTLYLHKAEINDIRIGYAINFCVDLEFHFKWNGHHKMQKISPCMLYNIQELRTVLFDMFCGFIESKQASRDQTGPRLNTTDFRDILFIYTENGPKVENRVHLDTIEKVNMAWESKRELYVSLRDTVKDDDELVGVFFDEEFEEPVLDFLKKKGLQISDTPMEYSVGFNAFFDFTETGPAKVDKIVSGFDNVKHRLEKQGKSVDYLRVRIAYDKDANPKYRTDFLCLRLQVGTTRQERLETSL